MLIVLLQQIASTDFCSKAPEIMCQPEKYRLTQVRTEAQLQM